MNKKLGIYALGVFVIYLTISGSNAYTDGEIIFQDNIDIAASSYQSSMVELDSSFDPNETNQGFRIHFELNITTQMDMVIIGNESAEIYNSPNNYTYNHPSIENITTDGKWALSYPLDPYHNGTILNSTGGDPFKFLIVIYNQGNNSVNVELKVSYIEEFLTIVSNVGVHFPSSFVVFSIIALVTVKSFFNKQEKIF